MAATENAVLTDTQIDALKPGRMMNSIVDQVVMGWQGLPPVASYSTSAPAAWPLTERMIALGWSPTVQHMYEGDEHFWHVAAHRMGGDGRGSRDFAEAYGATAAYAISLVALKVAVRSRPTPQETTP